MSTEKEGSVKRRQMGEEQAHGKGSPSNVGSPTLPSLISNMDSRWKNWWIRGILSFVMIGAFCIMIYLGPIFLTFVVIALVVKCFQEIVTIGYSKYSVEYKLPLYRVLNWYFLFVAMYFTYGDNFFYYYPEYRTAHGLFSVLAQYHRIVSFSLYIGGFMMFVVTLSKDYYQLQFGMFGWTHITIFILGATSYLTIQNIFEGLFWFLLPVSLVICNDIMAYLFGFFFGRTRLIKLSPKKTWEGFLGAFASTVVFGFILAYFLARHDYFICYEGQSSCERPPLFTPQEFRVGNFVVNLYPVQFHSFPLSIFAALIAPFGGFFASGFKRAFNIKDFADVIPGHGGITDRFDCQILMAMFANIYYFTFCRSPNPDTLISMLFALPVDKQLEILDKLRNKLIETGFLNQ